MNGIETPRTIRTGQDDVSSYIGIEPAMDTINFDELMDNDEFKGCMVGRDIKAYFLRDILCSPGPEYNQISFETPEELDNAGVRQLAFDVNNILSGLGYNVSISGRTENLRNRDPYLFVPKNNRAIENIPEVPVIEGIDYPKPPFMFKDRKTHKEFTIGGAEGKSPAWVVAGKKLDEGEIENQQYENVIAYAEWMEAHYVIEGQAEDATVGNIRTFNAEKSFFSEAHTNAERHQRMIAKFEFTYLGLEQKNTNGGTRWWASNAGYASGKYPSEVIARTIGVDAKTFADIVQKESGEHSHIVIRSDDYLIAVSKHGTNEEIAVVTEIMELSESGKEAYNLLMRAYERGKEDAS